MRITDAAYSNTDEEYREICAFLDALSTQDPCMHWKSGRMNFWRYNVHANKDPQGSFFSDNVHIWRAGRGEMVGLCISEYGKNDFFIEVMPAYHHIYPDIFRWMNSTWAATREVIEIDVYSEDAQKIARLEAQGFVFSRHFENKRFYDLEQIELDYDLEDGFTIQTVSESGDYTGRVALVRSAFNNHNYTEGNLRSLMASPDYIDEYNLMVVSPEGQPVAYCVGWHDHVGERCGYVEPVGTHADFRRRGFAKAVIRECFTRMKANGIRTVEISSWAEPAVANYLYDSLSPQTKRQVHRYVKKISRE